MEEKENQEENKRFDEISGNRKRTIINYCMMSIVQYKNRTASQLRVNQGNIKQKICTEYANQSGKLKGMQQELNFVDLVCDELIKNIKKYKSLQPSERKAALYKELEELGVIDREAERLSELDQIIEEVKGFEIENTGEARDASAKDNLARLNNPKLLYTNRETGKKEIKYGRYSEERTPTLIYDFAGRRIKMKKVGRLTYTNNIGMEDDMDQYLVTTEDGSREVFIYNMSQERIQSDEEYRKTFFKDLLSHENLCDLNSDGYIGEIIDIDGVEGSYKVDYVPERYTAVQELKHRLREKRRQQEDKVDPNNDR